MWEYIFSTDKPNDSEYKNMFRNSKVRLFLTIYDLSVNFSHYIPITHQRIRFHLISKDGVA